MSASVLISDGSHFRIQQIDQELETLQKLVDGYIEVVTDPRGEWHLYVDEEGKLKGKPANGYSTLFLDKLFTEAGRPAFSNYDVLVGTVVWLGPIVTIGDDEDSSEHSFPLNLLGKFVGLVMRNTNDDTPIVVIRIANRIIVFDQPTDSILEIKALVREARLRVAAGEQHDQIDVYANVSRGFWQEMRVDIMDHPAVDIDDRRADKSYG